MTPHRRAADVGEPVIHIRAEDRNPWAKAAAFADRYKILWLAGMALAGWFGTRVIQPLNQITTIANAQATTNARVDTVFQMLSAQAKTASDMAIAVTVLTKISCAKNLTASEQYAFGVDCSKLPPRKP